MFNNLHELISKMPDEKSCRDYLIQQRWGGKPVCPFCGHERVYSIEKGIKFKCASKDCYKKFSVTVGTIFEASNIKLNKWFMAIYLCTAHKKGISSYQLGKNIGVSQKSAWFMLHRIRELMKPKTFKKLGNTVEADATFIGGKVGNKSNKIRKEFIKSQNFFTNKISVLGITERKGDTTLLVMPDNQESYIDRTVRQNVEYASTVITDEGGPFRRLNDDFYHYTVNHSKHEYARLKYHTNSIEGVFSHLKRMYIGTYHHCSPWQLPAYLDEFAYRWNSRKMKDAERFKMALTQTDGRLPYKALKARNVLSLKYEAPQD